MCEKECMWVKVWGPPNGEGGSRGGSPSIDVQQWLSINRRIIVYYVLSALHGPKIVPLTPLGLNSSTRSSSRPCMIGSFPSACSLALALLLALSACNLYARPKLWPLWDFGIWGPPEGVPPGTFISRCFKGRRACHDTIQSHSCFSWIFNVLHLPVHFRLKNAIIHSEIKHANQFFYFANRCS